MKTPSSSSSSCESLNSATSLPSTAALPSHSFSDASASLLESSSKYTPACVHVIDTQPRRPITSLAIHDVTLYAGSCDGTISEYDLITYVLKRTLSSPFQVATKGITSMQAVYPRLLAASEDGAVVVWNLMTGSPSRTIRGHDGHVTAVCASADGKRFYSGGADRLINEWDIESGRRQWMLTGHTKWILSLCAGPLGSNRLYSGGSDHSIRIWDTSNGRCLKVLDDHKDWVFSLSLGRDLLYSSCKDGCIKVWDISTYDCLRSLRGHYKASAVRAITLGFGSGGKLYSAGDDKAIVEWDVKQGKPMCSMGGHFGTINSLCSGPFGRLYSASNDCSIRVWQVFNPANLSSFSSDAAAITALSKDLTYRVKTPPERRSSLNISSSERDEILRDITQTGHSTRHSNLVPSTLTPKERPPRMSSFLGDALSFAGLLSPNSEDDASKIITENYRQQLVNAQELLSKQNRLKFRLKSELAETRTELASCKAELALLRGQLDRAQDSEAELSAAKELLVAYKMELSAMQEANFVALDYVLRQSDASFLEIEMEVATMVHLLESPWTPLEDGNDSGDYYMPKNRARRIWEYDDDWDSDVELDEDIVWWRHDRKRKVRESSPECNLEEACESGKINGIKAIESESRSESIIYRGERSDAFDDSADLRPRKIIPSVAKSMHIEALQTYDVGDIYHLKNWNDDCAGRHWSSGSIDTPEESFKTVLWTGPVRDIGSIQERNGAPTNLTSALWTGPVVMKKSGGEKLDLDSALGEWKGPVKAPTSSLVSRAITDDKPHSVANSNLGELENVLYTGVVKSKSVSSRSSALGLGNFSMQNTESDKISTDLILRYTTSSSSLPYSLRDTTKPFSTKLTENVDFARPPELRTPSRSNNVQSNRNSFKARWGLQPLNTLVNVIGEHLLSPQQNVQHVNSNAERGENNSKKDMNHDFYRDTYVRTNTAAQLPLSPEPEAEDGVMSNNSLDRVATVIESALKTAIDEPWTIFA